MHLDLPCLSWLRFFLSQFHVFFCLVQTLFCSKFRVPSWATFFLQSKAPGRSFCPSGGLSTTSAFWSWQWWCYLLPFLLKSLYVFNICFCFQSQQKICFCFMLGNMNLEDVLRIWYLSCICVWTVNIKASISVSQMSMLIDCVFCFWSQIIQWVSLCLELQ